MGDDLESVENRESLKSGNKILNDEDIKPISHIISHSIIFYDKNSNSNMYDSCTNNVNPIRTYSCSKKRMSEYSIGSNFRNNFQYNFDRKDMLDNMLKSRKKSTKSNFANSIYALKDINENSQWINSRRTSYAILKQHDSTCFIDNDINGLFDEDNLNNLDHYNLPSFMVNTNRNSNFDSEMKGVNINLSNIFCSNLKTLNGKKDSVNELEGRNMV